jgi:hypothetical protein
MNANISSSSTSNVVDGKGNVLARCPWATAHGHGGGRQRCTALTASVRQAAIRNTGSPTIYFKVNACDHVKIPDAGRCYGSVKGLCNGLIQ